MLLKMTRRRWSDLVGLRVHAPPTSASVATPAKRWHDGAGAAGRGLAERSTRPLVALGSRWRTRARGRTVRSVLPSFALGAVTGPLWAPCAGPPVLGLVLTTAALQGPSTQTTLLHVAYAAGPSRAPTALDVHGVRISCLYPLAVVPLARGAERPQGQRKITGARRQADPCVH